MNYFLRLYIADGVEDEKIIAYAYAVHVDKCERQWSKVRLLKKPKLVILTSIISEIELEQFCKNLEGERFNINIQGEDISICSGLLKRPKVFTPPKEGFPNEAVSFINQLTITETFWNINKDALIQNIIAPYKHISDRGCREVINLLLDGLSEDVGMDFKDKAASKLGNVEIYTLLLSDDFFDISVDKERNGKALSIRKCRYLDYSIIVRCRLLNGNECISDSISEFFDQGFSIETHEPISHIEIQMWNKNTGQLVYMKSISLIRQFQLGMSVMGQNYKIVDPWSSELRKSFSKGENSINKIENVQLSYPQRKSTTGGYDEDKWVEASSQAKVLIDTYAQTNSKGAFCKKVSDKAGEIDSFLRILSYLCERRVTYAILVDPFFSVKAASKLLSRISNASMTLEIITSLTDEDPDTGSKNSNLIGDIKDFIERNKGVLHRNLIVWNILSGSKQAFHDRYLIRIFEDGTTDGYLLSNSLNSAGQSYPFVVAPMDKEVTYEVKEYLRDLKELGKENKSNKLTTGVLASEIWNSKNEKKSPLTQNNDSNEINLRILEFITREKGDIQQLLAKAMEQDFITKHSTIHELEIATETKNELLEELFNNYFHENDRDKSKQLLIVIGEMLYYCHGFHSQDVVDYIADSCIAKSDITELIKVMSSEVDKEFDEENIDISDEKRNYRSVLRNVESVNDKMSFAEAVFMNPPRIYDSRIAHMHMLYRLLVRLEPEKIEEILAETASPLAFGEMIEFIVRQWDEKLYLKLTNSLVPTLKEISYVWLWEKLEITIKGNEDTQEFIDRYMALPNVNSIYQLAYVISRLTYSIVYKHRDYWDIKNKYLKLLSQYLNEIEFEEKQFQLFISLLSGRQETESSRDLLDLYKNINGKTNIKNTLLIEVIGRLQRKLDNDESYYFSKSDWALTQYAAEAIFSLYGVETITYITKDFLNNKYFSTCSIPFLRDRDYGKWNIAILKSVWQLILIAELVAIDEVKDKETLIQKAISLFTKYLVPEVWNWHDNDNIVSEFILQVALWEKEGLLNSVQLDEIRELFNSNKTPRWAILYFYFLSNHSKLLGEDTLNSIKDIIDDSLASNELGDRRLMRISIGELIIYRLKQEQQEEVINLIRGLKENYVKIWMKGEEGYNEYLNWLATWNCDGENLQWKERGVGYVMIKNSISDREGEMTC